MCYPVLGIAICFALYLYMRAVYGRVVEINKNFLSLKLQDPNHNQSEILKSFSHDPVYLRKIREIMKDNSGSLNLEPSSKFHE